MYIHHRHNDTLLCAYDNIYIIKLHYRILILPLVLIVILEFSLSQSSAR